MTDAHYHLVVNHFPIIGTILGLGILVAGIIFKNNTVKNVSYALFIIAAVFAALSMGTGEGAEEVVEGLPNIGKNIIHNHEELAEKLAIVLYVLGLVSLFGIYTNIKNHSKAKLVSFLILIIAVVGVVLAQQVGTSGGEIRHTEIRKDYKAPNAEEEYKDKD
jgi:uncharacterized membrane protein